jgi:hypothetical protein
LDWVRGLYRQLGPALQALALKPGGILYYAHSVIKSEIFQLTRRDDPDLPDARVPGAGRKPLEALL